MLVCNLPRFYSFSQSICTPTVELPKLSAIVDSFYWHSQHHKHFYRGGCMVVGSHKVVVEGYMSHTKNSQIAFISAIFTSIYHTKQLNPWPIQYQYLSELLVNVYSYCLMVKSVSCCCVCGKWLFSDPVTNTEKIRQLSSYVALYVDIFYNYLI